MFLGIYSHSPLSAFSLPVPKNVFIFLVRLDGRELSRPVVMVDSFVIFPENLLLHSRAVP